MARKKFNYYNSYKKPKTARNKLYAVVGILFVGLIIFWIFKSGKDSQPQQISTVITPADDANSNQITPPADQTIRDVIALPGSKPSETEKPAPVVVVQETPPVENIKPDVVVETIDLPQTPANTEIAERLAQIQQQAKELIEKNQYISARDLLKQTLSLPLTATQRANVKKTLESLSNVWLFSDKVLKGDTLCQLYKVGPGQSLAVIAGKYNIPWQFIARINNITDPQRLQAGATIKVVNGPVNAIIYRSTFNMDVFLQDTYVKTYKVGLGRIGQGGNPTPTGLWKVKGDGKGKLKRPPWPDPKTGKLVYYEDPEYPLGERWIGLDGIDGDAKGRQGFGIHGTNEPDSIGKYESDGCIRMLNEDVVVFWDMVSSGTTEIKVVD